MPTDYTDYSVPRFFGQLTNQAMQLHQILGSQQREERMANIQEEQAVTSSFETMLKISQVTDRATRNYLLGLYAERQKTPRGRRIFGPETVVSLQKMGDEQRAQVMQVISSNAPLLAGMDPEQLAEMFSDPLQAMEAISKLGKISAEKQAAVAQQAEQEIFGAIDMNPALGVEQRIANLSRAITQGQARGARMEGAFKMLDDLMKERQQNAIERHQGAQESIARGNLGVSQGNLAVSRANLGLRQQELAIGRSSNPAERFAAEMFDTSFSRLNPEQRGKVNKRVMSEQIELRQAEGQAKADVALETLRYTPVQQKALTNINDGMTLIDQLKEIPKESVDRWVGYLKNPTKQAEQLFKTDADFQNFQAVTARLTNSELFSRESGGGGALTETERAALLKAIPSGRELGGSSQYYAKLKVMERTLKNRVNVIEKLGKARPGEAGAILEQIREEAAQARKEETGVVESEAPATHRYNPATGKIEAVH